MAPNRYLDGIGQRRFFRSLPVFPFLVLGFAAVLLALFFTATGRVRPPYDPGVLRGFEDAPIGMLVGLFCALAAGLFTDVQRLTKVRRKVRDAQECFDANDIEGAIRWARAALPDVSGSTRFQILSLLGHCAERRADFAQSVSLFELASTALPTLARLRARLRNAGVVAVARRAFSLACADRLYEAEITLKEIESASLPNATRGLVVRARALIESKCGRSKQLLDLLHREESTIRALEPRDRALLDVLDAHAKSRLGSVHRGPSIRIAVDDPSDVEWIGETMPEARPLLLRSGA